MLASDLFDTTPSDDTPIACNLSALDEPERHKAAAEELFQKRRETREVKTGIAMRFPDAIGDAECLLEFIDRERRCCPFLTFEIAFEPEERGLWLVFGGDEQAASFVKHRFKARAAEG